MDTDRIPTQPTTADEPPSVTSLTPGPSQAPKPEATGRGGRTALIGAVVGIALVVTFTAGIGVGRFLGPAASGLGSAPSPASSFTPTDFGLIREAWDVLHQRYVDRAELDDTKLIYGAIDGMTNAVGDTGHTDFMTPQERKQRDAALSGSYVGIGVRIEPAADGRPKIVGVFDDGPAKAAGLVPDDVILEVDGRPTEGASIDDVASWVRGEAGTTVTLVVRHGTDGPEKTVKIVRADVPIHPVTWAMVPGTKTALVAIEQFSNGAADDSVKALKAAREAGAQRIVLDLRGDPGGYVNEAVGVASQFLSSGIVYIERDADDHRTEHPVSPNGVATDLPVVVRAKIVGATTFGTGTVLGEFDLSDGSALRIGTTEWLTPKGRRIWHEGIAPDAPVAMPSGVLPLSPDDVTKLTADQAANVADPQLAKALDVIKTAAAASR
jgi:carboxyl-terminal processing protease